jgi:hypothetical protein
VEECSRYILNYPPPPSHAVVPPLIVRPVFVNSDPRAPIVGLRANTGARFENRDLPLALSLVRGGALGLRGLEAYS